MTNSAENVHVKIYLRILFHVFVVLGLWCALIVYLDVVQLGVQTFVSMVFFYSLILTIGFVLVVFAVAKIIYYSFICKFL